VHKDLWVLKERLDQQEHKEQLVLKGLRGHKVQSDLRVHKVLKVL
jgi:hypothetical protein